MSKFKIPGVSFSLNRALGITQAKQKFARETGFQPLRLDWKKIGKMVLSAIFRKEAMTGHRFIWGYIQMK